LNNLPTPVNMLTARDVLEMATINGARVAGLDGAVGSLTPGKKADVVVIDATAVNVAPVNDPVAAVTISADVSNVQHVLVNGEFRKRDFRLTSDLSRAMTLVGQAKDRLQAALADRRAAAARAAEAAPAVPEDTSVTVVQAVAATDATGAVQAMGTVESTGATDSAAGAL
jgi:cytosine/adenosine deaminase-related metal-dependent hydrolase